MYVVSDNLSCILLNGRLSELMKDETNTIYAEQEDSQSQGEPKYFFQSTRPKVHGSLIDS